MQNYQPAVTHGVKVDRAVERDFSDLLDPILGGQPPARGEVVQTGRRPGTGPAMDRSFERLFREMKEGYALHEIICDPLGRPIDYRFLAVNPAYEDITGLSGEMIIGKTVLEVLPNTEPYWIETYGLVALNGTAVFFEHYSWEFERFFKVTAYQPEPKLFACLFNDITEHERSQVLLDHQAEELKRLRVLVQSQGNQKLGQNGLSTGDHQGCDEPPE